VHQKLLDIGAVRLVGRQREAELHRADDAAVNTRDQQSRLAARDFSCHLGEEGFAVLVLERRHEAHRRAARDAVDQHLGEFGNVRCGDELCDTNLRGRAHAARSRFSATVESALSR
jgi:hypothetical protein